MKNKRSQFHIDLKFFSKTQETSYKRMWTLLLLGVLLLSACARGEQGAVSSSSAVPSASSAPTSKVSSALSQLFPKIEGVEYIYHGYAEYGQRMHFAEQDEKAGALILRYEGKVEDGYGNNGKDRSFSVTYTIDDQKVVQHVENKDPLRSQDKEGTMESLIPDKVILQLPLSKQNSWTQNFTWQEKSYTATSTITSTGKTPQGNAYYEVKTQVPGMKTFYGGVYKEGMIFEENTGMISFYHSIPEAAIQLSSGVTPTEDMYMFGFSFTKTQP